MEEKIKIFIAYGGGKGEEIAGHLRKQIPQIYPNMELFMAPDDVPPGTKNPNGYIHTRIPESDFFLKIHTIDCDVSKELEKEITIARKIAKERSYDFIQILKAKKANCDEQWLAEFDCEGMETDKENALTAFLNNVEKVELCFRLYKEQKNKENEPLKPTDKEVGVVIPYHNAKFELEMCIECLSLQSKKPHEVIIIDDNSNNSITDIIKKYNEKIKIRYIKLPYGNGESGRRALARLIGTYLCSSEFVLYLDQDTLLPKDTILGMLNKYSSNCALYPQSYSVPSNVLSEGKEKIIEYVNSSPRVRNILRSYSSPSYNKSSFWLFSQESWENVPFNCFLINKSTIEEVGYFDINYVGYGEEDTDIKYRLHKNGIKFKEVVYENCASYHIENEVTKEEENKRLEEWIKNAKYLLTKFKRKKKNNI